MRHEHKHTSLTNEHIEKRREDVDRTWRGEMRKEHRDQGRRGLATSVGEPNLATSVGEMVKEMKGEGKDSVSCMQDGRKGAWEKR